MGILTLGGYLYLNNGRLSIINLNRHFKWKPISNEEWNKEFEIYKDEYSLKKDEISIDLDKFKNIYCIENYYKSLGEIFIIFFVVPFVIFSRKGILTRHEILKSLGIFSLVSFQGIFDYFLFERKIDDKSITKFNYKENQIYPFRLTFNFYNGLLIFSFLLQRGLFFMSKPQILKNSIFHSPSANCIRKNVIISLHALGITSKIILNL